jgi:hypothetical protein
MKGYYTVNTKLPQGNVIQEETRPTDNQACIHLGCYGLKQHETGSLFLLLLSPLSFVVYLTISDKLECLTN